MGTGRLDTPSEKLIRNTDTGAATNAHRKPKRGQRSETKRAARRAGGPEWLSWKSFLLVAAAVDVAGGPCRPGQHDGRGIFSLFRRLGPARLPTPRSHPRASQWRAPRSGSRSWAGVARDRDRTRCFRLVVTGGDSAPVGIMASCRPADPSRPSGCCRRSDEACCSTYRTL